MSLPLQKRATISDVARLAGVSISTVSRVVNGNAPVAGDTIHRVREAIDALHYTPSSAARSLAGRRTNTIGLYLPQISGGFFSALFQGVETGVREAGFDLLIHAHPELTGGPAHGTPLAEHNTDGVLIFTHSVPDKTIVNLVNRGLPLVLLFRTSPEGIAAPSVTIENETSAEELVGHLIDVHACRRVAFLRGPRDNQDSAQREQGYRNALAKRAIPLESALIARGEYRSDRACEVVAEWLHSGLHFDALFAGDDESAMGALHALRAAGRRVPQDVALVGFDDVSVASLVMPPLTTVHVPIETAGFIAAQTLVALIQTGQAPVSRVLPTEIVIRQSCGCQ